MIPENIPARPTRAIVDLDAISGNVRTLRNWAPRPVRLMAVVKANGYGHGATMVARSALGAGVDCLGVATVQEGIRLRQDGINVAILVMGPIDASEIGVAIRHRLALAAAALDLIDSITAEASAIHAETPVEIHLKIDTGMRRYGCLPDQAIELANVIHSRSLLTLAGVFTHFACADETDESRTVDQTDQFYRRLSEMIQRGIDPGTRHAANSAAMLRSRRFDFDMVRVGIALYGVTPSDAVGLLPGMRPAMTIVSRISRVIQLEPGDRVSYGGAYEAKTAERAALLPIGYGDGYRRALSNRGWMGFQGCKLPVLGRVCMDQTVVGLPSKSDARVGDDAIVVGPPETGAPSWEKLAEITGTIGYEMLTCISARVPRFYVSEGRLVAVEDLTGLRMIES